MALKFRRGTTAQKSGSLAFGEPYVNTTIGALQIGLESSDLTIRSVDSSSAVAITSLSASLFVSASSLKVTGNASIDGNLSLGGNITIGDATSDTLNVVANLSSSLIPSVTNAFDLGSADKIWKDLYISTGSIKFVDGTSVVNTFSSNTLTTILQSTGSSDARFTQIGVVSGSLIASASSFETRNASLATITGSLISSASVDQTRFTSLATISGSLISSASSFETRNASLATITGSLITSASSFETRNASLATISGSLILTASNNVQRLTAMEAVSGSWVTESETSSFARTNTTNIFTTNQVISGGLDVTGTITANEFHTTYVSSSVMYNSGSNRFGDSADDLQQLIGIVEITGSIKGNQFNQLATITGSLITSASNLTQRVTANESISASYARVNSANMFVGDQTITGSLVTSGSRVEFNVQWPSAPGEQHIVKTSPFTIGGRQYEYGGFALEHFEDTPGTYHNAWSIYMFDSGSNFGSEMIVGPLRSHMRIYPSGSGGQIANISVQDLDNGSTQALVYGDFVQIGAWHAESIIIGNSGSVTEISGSIKTAQLNAIGTITGSLISSASSFETRNASLATITGSLIITASNNVVSITNLNTFSSSQLTKDSTLATYTGSVETRLTEIGVVSGSLISSASTAKTTNDSQGVSITNLNTYTASLQAGIQMTGSTVSILGDLKVYGTQSIITSTNVQIQDNIIYLSPTASIDNDLGIVGHYNDGTYRHAGIFMDASDGHTWKVFNGLTDETTAQVDVNGTGFTLADFKAGVITGTSFNGTINATNGVISGSSQVNLASVTGNSTSNVTEGTNLYYLDSRVKTKLNAEGVISGSSQLTTEFDTRYLNTGADSVVSGSSQIDATATTNWTTGIKTQLNSNTVISGSSQVDLTSTTNYSSGILTRLNAVGVFSGSSQVDLTTTTNYASGILTRLNVVGVFSGSSQVSGITNAQLVNTTISGKTLGTNLDTLTIGTGLSGTSYNGSSAVTIANTGVTSITGTTNQVVASASTGGVTLSLPQSINSTATPTFGNLTINGTITATGDITAYYTSDRRHKNNIKLIPNALSKVTKLNGVTWEWNDDVNEVTKSTPKTGLIAQEVQEVLPEVVVERENGYLGLDYSKMVGLLVEAIKEQQIKIDNLTIEVEKLKKQKGL